MASARIQRRYNHCELANFDQHTDSLRAAFKQSVRFIEAFPVVDRGLLFHGAHGVGKTHLAVSVLKAAIREKGARGYFYETGELLKLIRDTYDAGAMLNEMDVLRPVLEADLLVLDDLGVEKTSEWVQETLGHVINIRYSERRPTIFTTNLIDSSDSTDPRSFMFRLGSRTRSRLFEMCDWIEMDSIDAREVQDATPEGIQRWQKQSPASPRNQGRSRSSVPAKSSGQLRAEPRIPRERDGKADLKWPGGRAGSQ